MASLTSKRATGRSGRLLERVTWIGLVAWGVTLAAAIGYTLFSSNNQNVTVIYRMASEAFWQAALFYPASDAGPHLMGFLYLPGFAVLYLPFEWMGARLGDAAWKAAGWALVTYAAWSQCSGLERSLRLRVLSIAFALAIPLIAGGVLNGQANIHLGAACWLAILSAFRRETLALVFWTGIAILLKPLAMVVILLIGGLSPLAIPALAGGIVWALALPFAVADMQYVIGLYQDFARTLMSVSENFAGASDFTAISTRLGWTIPAAPEKIVRVVAALATWTTALWLYFKLPPNARALSVMVLAASYMCLFNPRAEGLTYTIVALPCAVVIAMHLFEGSARPWWIAAAAVLVLMGSNSAVGSIFQLTKFWFKPALLPLVLILMALALSKTWAGNSRAGHLLDKDRRDPVPA